jgi:hypothetical protein
MERTLSSELFFEDKAVNTQASLPLRVIANLMLWQRRISSRHQLARLDSRRWLWSSDPPPATRIAQTEPVVGNHGGFCRFRTQRMTPTCT